jgi:hypothetical protein
VHGRITGRFRMPRFLSSHAERCKHDDGQQYRGCGQRCESSIVRHRRSYALGDRHLCGQHCSPIMTIRGRMTRGRSPAPWSMLPPKPPCVSGHPLAVSLSDRSAAALHLWPRVESRAATIAALSLVSAAVRSCNSVTAYSCRLPIRARIRAKFPLGPVDVKADVPNQIRLV